MEALLSTFSALLREEGGPFRDGVATQTMAVQVGGAYGLQLDDWIDGQTDDKFGWMNGDDMDKWMEIR